MDFVVTHKMHKQGSYKARHRYHWNIVLGAGNTTIGSSCLLYGSSEMGECAPQGAPNQLVTNINKEVIFYRMVFEGHNLGPSASNSACGSTAKKAA